MLARAKDVTAAGVNCNKHHLSFPFQLILNIYLSRHLKWIFKKHLKINYKIWIRSVWLWLHQEFLHRRYFYKWFLCTIIINTTLLNMYYTRLNILNIVVFYICSNGRRQIRGAKKLPRVFNGIFMFYSCTNVHM